MLHRKLIIPGEHTPEDLAESRAHEQEADLFAATLGVKGAVRVPGVLPLFSYSNFISRPPRVRLTPASTSRWAL